MCLNLKNNAIFVADAHYNSKREQFAVFLNDLLQNKIETSQIFLMGDMFDFISSESKYFVEYNKEVVSLLNKVSKKFEIIYLEGNHDYNLQFLFPNIKIIKREDQPLKATYQNKRVAISHGDNFTSWDYNIYCKIIRNHYFLKFLNLVDFKNFISKSIYRGLSNKNICTKINNFKRIVEKRLENYNDDIIVEGHFHQGKTYNINNKLYINVPSLFCENCYLKLNNEFIKVNL